MTPETLPAADAIPDALAWTVIVLLGLGTFAIRFSFLGLLGDRPLPEWLLGHLKYVGVAVFPALVTPLVLWPEATQGAFDPLRLVAALAAFAAGWRISVVAAIVAGMGTLYALQFLATLI
ncbi:AzlD domain-containing protein [Palleronia sediminis]|uniref:AzlD domain-containing protein n=1 Tax=Palleronia sediminis TaxID=2547833 RepID=A0A4R6ALP8_9RHOB|nr:AzlD domain-containing protein [Palleronia sediminis]TDL84184.1 AzlD domain-containing protein [Palleronia sediminis]